MCEPVTLLSIGVGMAGAEMSAASAAAYGQVARQRAQINAQSTRILARDAIVRAELVGTSSRMRAGQVICQQQLGYAASGAAVGIGSTGDVTRREQVISDIDEEVIRNNAARQAYGFLTKAQAEEQQGADLQAQANNQALMSIIGGVGKSALVGAKAWLEQPTSIKGDGDTPVAWDDLTPEERDQVRREEN